VKTRHPERVAELFSAYRDWRAEMGRIPVAVGETTGEPVLLAEDERLDPDDGDFSLCLRVLPERDAIVQGGSLVSKGESWELAIEPGGRVRFRARGRSRGRPATLELRSGEALEAGRWTHVALTLAGGNVRRAALHLDGRPSAASAGIHPEVDARPVSVGAGGDGQPFRGRISDLGFWSLELTGEEIAELAAAPPDGAES
jgi:hypothetical protein